MIPVSLVRVTAKVQFSLTIAPEVSGQIVLQTVQIVNAPRTVSYFSDNREAGELLNYSNKTFRAIRFRDVLCARKFTGRSCVDNRSERQKPGERTCRSLPTCLFRVRPTGGRRSRTTFTWAATIPAISIFGGTVSISCRPLSAGSTPSTRAYRRSI